MNDGYLYNWISEANEINGYSPRLAESCYVYRKDELGVLTVELEYVDYGDVMRCSLSSAMQGPLLKN